MNNEKIDTKIEAEIEDLCSECNRELPCPITGVRSAGDWQKGFPCEEKKAFKQNEIKLKRRECIIIAARMLEMEPAKLNPVLVRELAFVDELCRKEGGYLRSTQVIGKIILDCKKYE